MDIKPGVYKLPERDGDAKSPVVYFDGKKWWLPGWECPVQEPAVFELLWEDKEL